MSSAADDVIGIRHGGTGFGAVVTSFEVPLPEGGTNSVRVVGNPEFKANFRAHNSACRPAFMDPAY